MATKKKTTKKKPTEQELMRRLLARVADDAMAQQQRAVSAFVETCASHRIAVASGAHDVMGIRESLAVIADVMSRVDETRARFEANGMAQRAPLPPDLAEELKRIGTELMQRDSDDAHGLSDLQMAERIFAVLKKGGAA